MGTADVSVSVHEALGILSELTRIPHMVDIFSYLAAAGYHGRTGCRDVPWHRGGCEYRVEDSDWYTP